jgi:tetratricopeptide (TPR) repeat protein
MKLMFSTAAVALLAASAPAAAQYSPYGQGAASMQTPVPQDQSKPQQAKQQPQPASGPKPSQHALKALIELQTAVKAKDTANIPAKIAAAQAAATTKEDRYLIARLQLTAAIQANDNAGAASAIDAVASSGVLDQPAVAELYKGLGGSFYNAKQYDKALAAFNRAVALNPRDYDSLDLIAESYLGEGQKAQAAAAYGHAIAAHTAAGQKPDENLYKKAVQLAYDARSPNATEAALQWVAAYPSANSWHNAVAIFRNLNQPDTEGTLDLLRLLQAAGALNTPGDYALFTAAAAEQLNYNEAQAVIDAGIAAHIVDPSDSQFRQMVSALKTKTKSTAADLQAAVKMSPTATNLLRIGDRYAAMGDYAQAADIYRQVLAKPGADADLANLPLGMALARAGDKAGATAALNAVKGGRAGIAKYWLLFVSQHG